jgi:hypothetical protein
MDDELLAVACMPGLSHGSFRLYAILAGVARQRGARDAYFPVTLTGLKKIHPGTAERVAGDMTIIKQVAELRQRNLLTTGSVALERQASLHRNKPDTPILVKLHYPNSSQSWEATDGSRLNVSTVQQVVELR